MKHKKLFAFMIILSTLIACCNMSISASDIWENEDKNIYLIQPEIFKDLDDTHHVSLAEGSKYKAYIYYNGETVYILGNISGYVYRVYKINQGIFELDIEPYTIFINQELYDYWISKVDSFPTIGELPGSADAKDIFDLATVNTLTITEYIISAFWDNGLTFLGWLIAIAFGLITTVNIIRMISNSLWKEKLWKRKYFV